MRAISLVRYWLYGLRGFVVMTASLAIAFSIAVTGPPTDTEIKLVTAAFDRAADGVGEDLEAAAIELCPQLPEEMHVFCAPTLSVEEGPRPAAPLEQAPTEIASVEPPRLTPAPPEADRPTETQLLGAPQPPQRARPQRAQHERRVAQRPQAHRRAPRAQPQRPVRVQPAQAAPPPSVAVTPRAPASENNERGIEDRRRDQTSYQDDEEQEYQEWRERRRERRRRRYEREYEPAPEAHDEPAYRDDYYEEEEWTEDMR